MPFKCPECNRSVPLRKHRRCAYCGADVPENMRFTEEELYRLERMKEEDAEKYRRWKEESAKENIDGLSDGFDFDIDV